MLRGLNLAPSRFERSRQPAWLPMDRPGRCTEWPPMLKLEMPSCLHGASLAFMWSSDQLPTPGSWYLPAVDSGKMGKYVSTSSHAFKTGRQCHHGLALHKFDRKLDREFSLFERDAIGVLLSLRSKIEGTGLQFVEITSQHGHQGLMWRR